MCGCCLPKEDKEEEEEGGGGRGGPGERQLEGLSLSWEELLQPSSAWISEPPLERFPLPCWQRQRLFYLPQSYRDNRVIKEDQDIAIEYLEARITAPIFAHVAF